MAEEEVYCRGSCTRELPCTMCAPTDAAIADVAKAIEIRTGRQIKPCDLDGIYCEVARIRCVVRAVNTTTVLQKQFKDELAVWKIKKDALETVKQMLIDCETR